MVVVPGSERNEESTTVGKETTTTYNKIQLRFPAEVTILKGSTALPLLLVQVQVQ